MKDACNFHTEINRNCCECRKFSSEFHTDTETKDNYFWQLGDREIGHKPHFHDVDFRLISNLFFVRIGEVNLCHHWDLNKLRN